MWLYTYNTDTANRGEDRTDTGKLPDLHLEDGTSRQQGAYLCQPDFF